MIKNIKYNIPVIYTSNRRTFCILFRGNIWYHTSYRSYERSVEATKNAINICPIAYANFK